ncbi:MAG: winged helix-turn-helix domain-containing protein [Burkholderiales bacterium]|nr:winged helix-turn-helix domain-containing protein [Burkholderiales bacterium]
MRMLLVEDDNLLGDGIQAGLAQAGFGVDWVKDGVAADLALETGQYAAVVLDLGLPRLSGLGLLRRMRAAGNKVPVLILTARDAIEDRIKGLDGGADDYMVKPFDLHELAARLRALIRRSRGEAAPLLCVGEVELDPAARRAAFKGKPLELSTREFALLHELMLNAGHVLSREQLGERLYAWGEEIESNAIDVHVHHLRRKLASGLIRTVRGVGYLMPRARHG